MAEPRTRGAEPTPPTSVRRPVLANLDERARRRPVAQLFAEIDWNGDRSVGRVTMEQLLGAL